MNMAGTNLNGNMNKHRIALWFLGLILVSCSIQEINDGEYSIPVQYYASIEKTVEEGTRVYANDQLRLRWDADDRVSIFRKDAGNNEYRFAGETGAGGGAFEEFALAVFGEAGLLVECRAAVVEVYRKSGYEHDGAQDDEREPRGHDVESAL